MKFNTDPAEQTTAATDIIIAFVAFGGILFLRLPVLNGTALWKINIWAAAIGLIGLAATLGAAAHGLVLSPRIHHRIWLILNMALALAVSLFVVGVVYDLWGLAASLKALPIMLVAGLSFYLATWRWPGIFFVFIIYEGLSLFFALGAYAFLAIQEALRGAGWMSAGILISIVAAGIQANKSVRITLFFEFDHNGIYHLVQTIGLLFLLVGLRWSVING
ncbi:MAG: hypothetical protein HKO68_00280 [Desulfobacterales bacterium]|nr:hypothetical protein [Desulfobacterales bacterium]